MQKIDQNVPLTNKLLSENKSSAIILFDAQKYYKKRRIEKKLIQFILKNFWYYLSDIKYKAKKCTLKSQSIDFDLLDMLHEHDLDYEFPRRFYNRRDTHNGCTLKEYDEKIKAEENAYIWCSPPIENEFHQKIKENISSKIAGRVLTTFANSSVSKVLGLKINYI